MDTFNSYGSDASRRSRFSRLGLHPETVSTDPTGTTVAIDTASGRLAVGTAGFLSTVALDDVTDVTLRPGKPVTAMRLDFTPAAGAPLTLHFADAQEARLAQLRIAIALVRRHRGV